jgi:hypothetical protein
MKKFTLLFLSSAFIFCLSCEKKKSEDQNEDPYSSLGSYAYTVYAENVKELLSQYNLNSLHEYVQYDVSVHHITYATTYKGSTVTASGAICIPIGPEPLPVASYQHGTIFYDAETPSGYSQPSSWGFELMSTNGYVTFVPDYIGYGTSREMIHPYHLYTPSVDAVIDMIIEGKGFLEANEIPFDTNGIYLAGFSEGGYVTFAVQKEIEFHPEFNLTVKASAPGAGAYELEYMFDRTMQSDYYGGPGYMGLAILAYNDYYWNEPLEHFFNPSYLDEIETVFDGTYTEREVHNSFPDYLSEFLDPDFLEEFRNDPESPFRARLVENSLNNWLVNSPTRFIHGTGDQTVPFSVAQKTYDDLISLGVSQDDLSLQSFSGGHESFTYLALALDWFKEFRE